MERWCIAPTAKDTDLWILKWKNCVESIKKGVRWRSSVKTHRSKKEMQRMSLFEKFITEGNCKSDELAKEGAMLDGGGMAHVQERDEVSAAL